ncbi:hypothetical protein NUH86_15325 [Sphingobium sp. JS3065]|uniref:hypothetical protein n=1 Tax=Sphingobium sp. JS3065 TaxID=2970925 RepID=UPI0022640B9B|nr:hypothetical protein [Sphingobium sp. JS3065]UZW54832.1 hypothetical protein NUH86_15325 [Sphingobium sp. JS3065]
MTMIIDKNAAVRREPHAVESASVIFVTGNKGGAGKSFKALSFMRLSRTSWPQAASPKWR